MKTMKQLIRYSVLDKFLRAPVVPTVFPMPLEHVAHFIRLLHEEDYPTIEILCRPPEAAFRLMRLLNRRPERKLISLSIGTVLTEDIARQAVRLQPDVLVSPAFSRRVLDIAFRAGVAYVPGVSSFQDVQDVVEAFAEKNIELKILKMCPFITITPQYLEMLAGCYPGIVFCPSGDPQIDSLRTYARWRSKPLIGPPMSSGFIPRVFLDKNNTTAIRKALKKIRRLWEQAEKRKSRLI